MMKKVFTMALAVMILIVTTGCTDEIVIVDDPLEDQIITARIIEYSEQDSTIDQLVDANLYTEPMIGINYCTINDTTFDSAENFEFGIGNCNLHLTPEQVAGLNLDNNVYFEMNTDLGSLSGSVSRPAMISDIKINGIELDTLSSSVVQTNVGEDIIVSWSYQLEKPDYFQINAFYEGYDSLLSDYYNFEILKTVSNNDSSFTLLEANETSLDGEIYLTIYRINGPDVSNNEVSNLQGSGVGYLHWICQSDQEKVEIQVGSGKKINK